MKTRYMTSSKVLKRPDKGLKITQTRKMSADLEFKPEEVEYGDEEKRGRVTELGAIIPDEILTIIFGNLTAPKDLSSVSQSCHRFRNVINQQLKEWRVVQALPHILPYLPKEDILNCRVVSPLWNQRVGFTLQTHCRPPPWSSPNFDIFFKSFKAKPFTPMRLTSALTLTSTYATLEKIPFDRQRNPFVTRWISLGYTGRYPEDCWCHAILFMREYGHYIWHLNLSMSPILYSRQDTKTPDYYQIYEIFLDILNLTPNLKSLELQFQQVTAKSDIHPDNQFFVNFLQKRRVPVEKLRKLVSLYLTGSPRYVQIQSSVLSQLSGQLEKIEIGGKLEESLKTLLGGLGGVGGLSFDKLKELNLKLTDPKLVIKLLGKMEAPSLRKVALDMEVSGSAKILETFQSLKRFPSLECVWWHVEVKGRGGTGGGADLAVEIEPLMNLKYLEVVHFEGLSYKKLLKFLPVLKEVTVFGRKRYRSRRPADLDSVVEMGRSEKMWRKEERRKLERFVVKEHLGVGKTLLCACKVLVENSRGSGRKHQVIIYE